MSKVDGRKLRKDVKDFIEENYPGKDPIYTVRTIVKSSRFYGKVATLEVRFDELDQDALDVWSEVADYVSEVWWPKNRKLASASYGEWDYGKTRRYTTIISHVSVGYGFTH